MSNNEYITKNDVYKIIDNLKCNFTCFDCGTLDEVFLHVKDLPLVCKTETSVIEELEHLKAVIRFNGLYDERIEDLIDIEIKGWKGENK